MDLSSDTNPEAAVAPAELRETHSGIVVLIGDRAYKVKKPVDLGFLDYRTEPSRQRACRRELELNRRLAPDVYLELASVNGPDGDVRDHVVVMRRMPDAARLTALVKAGVDLREPLRALARLISEFHAAADRGPEISAEGRAGALRRRWVSNLDEAKALQSEILAEN